MLQAKTNKGLARLSHFSIITQLATSGNEAIRNTERLINKGMARLERAQGGNMRGETASWLQVPKARKGPQGGEKYFTV